MMETPAVPAADSPETIATMQQKLARPTSDQLQLKRWLDKTSRSGAYSRLGGLGIRPHGDITDDLDRFLNTKAPRPPRPLTDPIEVPDNGRRDSPFQLRMRLPRNFCPDCGRTDRPPVGGAMNLLVAPVEWPHLRLRQGDAVINFFCQECCERFKAQQSDPAGDLILVGAGQEARNRELESAIRSQRITENTNAYIIGRLMADDDSIWVRKHE